MTGAVENPESLSADTDSVQIVKGGEVGEDELAALVAGIVAASAAGAAEEPSEENTGARWSRPARRAHAFPRHGRDAWRWSLRS